MEDPTVRFLEDLDDARLYHKVRDVPVFVPHKLKKRDQDGKEVEVEVTEEDLYEIAENANAREEDTGTLAVVTLGHRLRDPKAPERDQPPVVGYARDWKVGTFGKKKKPCLLVTQYVRQQDRAEAGGFPFRSIEYYPKRHEATAVCLLKRDPELDMGVVAYSGEVCLIYSREVNPMPDLPDPTMAPDASAPDLAPVDDSAQLEEYQRHCASHPYAKTHYEKMLQYANAAMPSATNGLPDPLGDPAGLPPLPGAGPEQFQRDLDLVQYRKENTALKARAEAAEKRVQEAEHKGRLVNYQRELEKRVALGVELNVKEELDDVRDLTDAQQFQRQAGRNLVRIDRRYTRAPVGGELVRTLDEEPAQVQPEGAISEREADAALVYMRQNKCEWKDAVQAIKSK